MQRGAARRERLHDISGRQQEANDRHELARRAARLATVLGLATVVGVSGWFVLRYDTLYESHHSLDGDEYFTR